MKIGLVGSGGREHAIAEGLMQQPERDQLVVFGNSENYGIKQRSIKYEQGMLTDNRSMVSFFEREAVDFVVVGPELPLINGLVDELRDKNIFVVGPNKEQARLEGDKAYMRNFMKEHIGWGSPRWCEVHSRKEALEFIDEVNEFVIKPIGLTGGKGVQVMGVHLSNRDEAISSIESLLDQNPSVLLEERLFGEEFSRIVIVTDGHIVPMPIAQDFKYAFAGDTGGMTGGMGSYTMSDGLMPFLQPEDIEQADQLIGEVIKAVEGVSGSPYRGFLYAQFMATRQGVSIIEFNARLGDPEAINEMALLNCDTPGILYDVACGTLDPKNVIFKNEASLCKYLVPNEYPHKKQDGLIFTLDEDKIEGGGFFLRYASVEKTASHWRTLGSRAMAILGLGDTPEELNEKIENLLAEIEPPGLRHREDIGSSKIIQEKIERMKSLRAGE